MSALAWSVEANRTLMAVVALDGTQSSQTGREAEVGGFQVTAYGTLPSAMAGLRHERPEVVLVDLGRQPADAAEGALLLCSTFPDLPMVARARLDGRGLALRLLRGGVQDFIASSLEGDTAGRLRLAIERHRRDRGRVRAALDRMPCSVLVCTAEGRIYELNRRAEALLGAGRGLRVQRSVIAASRPEDTRRLGEALRAACASRGGQDPDLHMVDLGPGSGRRLAVQVAPFLVPDGPGAGMALLVVPEPDRDPPRREAALEVLYQLTPAEARVATLLMHGQSIGDACARLDISIHTGRTHLKRVLDKTGARRQGELVARLWSEAAFLDPRPRSG